MSISSSDFIRISSARLSCNESEVLQTLNLANEKKTLNCRLWLWSFSTFPFLLFSFFYVWKDFMLNWARRSHGSKFYLIFVIDFLVTKTYNFISQKVYFKNKINFISRTETGSLWCFVKKENFAVELAIF